MSVQRRRYLCRSRNMPFSPATANYIEQTFGEAVLYEAVDLVNQYPQFIPYIETDNNLVASLFTTSRERYLVTDGTAYINTKIPPANSDKIELDFARGNTGDGIHGLHDPSAPLWKDLIMYVANGYNLYAGGVQVGTINVPVGTRNKLTFEVNYPNVIFACDYNQQSGSHSITSANTSANPCYLYAVYRVGVGIYGVNTPMRVYRYTRYINEVKRVELVPFVNEFSIAGLLDIWGIKNETAEEVFYTPYAGGSFSAFLV